ncbi:hypothetical protein [Streptomyces gilvosporeus]|uniref:hypothetical protein n=1 Tax=Streptomyces gilvosporeus TaxID=553510 RepID=UPI00131AFC6F|nr:hypothetical protein [Streptomyces gilvosporeus]
MTGAQPAPPPDWVADILARWVPPEDYDARMSAVVDGYLADTAKKARCLPDPSRHQRATP